MSTNTEDPEDDPEAAEDEEEEEEEEEEEDEDEDEEEEGFFDDEDEADDDEDDEDDDISHDKWRASAPQAAIRRIRTGSSGVRGSARGSVVVWQVCGDGWMGCYYFLETGVKKEESFLTPLRLVLASLF